MEVWPQNKQSMAAKLNAITRLVIILTLLGYLFTRSIKIPITGAITIGALVLLQKSQKQKKKLKKKILKEGLTNPQLYKKMKGNF